MVFIKQDIIQKLYLNSKINVWKSLSINSYSVFTPKVHYKSIEIQYIYKKKDVT